MTYEGNEVKDLFYVIFDQDDKSRDEVYIFFENGKPVHGMADDYKDEIEEYFRENGVNRDSTNAEEVERFVTAHVIDNTKDEDLTENIRVRFNDEQRRFNDSQSNIDRVIDTDDDNVDENDDNVDENEDENEEDYDNEEKKHLSKGAKAGIGVGVAAAIATAGVGAYHLYKYRDRDKDKSNTSADSKFAALMNELDANHPRRIFCENIVNTAQSLNSKLGRNEDSVYIKNSDGTVKEYIFALDKDKIDDETIEMKFSYDELLAAKVALNNYTDDELYKIFGDTDIDTLKMENDYKSFLVKVQTYYMNAKAPSGLADLIDDADNKKWFETIENSIIEFNKDVNQENADKVIKTFIYLYEQDYAGSSKFKVNNATINAVKNVAFNAIIGYVNANSATEEYTKYLRVSSKPGDFDNTLVKADSDLVKVQKGERLTKYIDKEQKEQEKLEEQLRKELEKTDAKVESGAIERVNNTSCTLGLVFERIEDSADKLNNRQINLKSEYQLALVNALMSSSGTKKQTEIRTKLADRVFNEEMTEELSKEIKKYGNKDIKNALKAYENVDSISKASMVEIKEAADELIGEVPEYNIILFINRQRGKTLELKVTENDGVLDKSKWDKMSNKEKIEYAKKNGTVIKTETKKETKKVSEKDLTPEEKKSVEKQKEEKKMENGVKVDNSGKTVEMEVNLDTYSGQGAKDGANWATTGTYKYNGKIVNKVNPDAPTTVYNNGDINGNNSFYSIARSYYAYQDGATGPAIVVTESDSSIKSALDKDVNKFKQTNSNAGAAKAYKDGWLQGVQATLDAAVKAGKLERSKAETLYNQAKNRANTEVNNNNNNNNAPVVDNNPAPTTPADNNNNNNNNGQADDYIASDKPVTDNDNGTYNDDPNLNTDTSNDEFIDEGKQEPADEWHGITTTVQEVAVADVNYDAIAETTRTAFADTYGDSLEQESVKVKTL